MTLGSRRTGRRLLAPFVAAALSLPLAAGPAQAAPAVAFTARAGGLSQPTQVTSARDGRARMFVVEKTGLVRIFAGGKLLARPFLDLRSRVRTDGEGGLLSIAFHPSYRNHPVLWAAYTSTSGDLRVARFRARTATANRVPLSSYHRVIDVPHPAASPTTGAASWRSARAGCCSCPPATAAAVATPRTTRRTGRACRARSSGSRCSARTTPAATPTACRPATRSAAPPGPRRDLGPRAAQRLAVLGGPDHR